MTMVDRVAREIARRRAIRILDAAGSDERYLKEFTVIRADMDAARAAIEAMRTPTDRMADDGYRAMHYGADDVWQAMIDAALSE